MMNMKRIFSFLLVLASVSAAFGQGCLTLDSCRAMALRQNKQLAIAGAEVDRAMYERRAAGTNYLPKVSLAAGYLYTSKELSLLSDAQKNTLSGLGTNLRQAMGQILQQHPDLAALVPQLQPVLDGAVGALNGAGQSVVDAFHTDTRQIMAGTILLTQPLYMGGKIRAYDRITHYAEDIAREKLRAGRQDVILEVDQAYWQVVSLAGKRRLALSYRDMLQRLNGDVQLMIAEGVATKANGLNVSVKLNEAEMTLLKVEDGLTLARMLLCQVCGLPLDAAPTLAEEEAETLAAAMDSTRDYSAAEGFDRPEINQLQYALRIYDEKVKVQRSAFLPQLALMGGYVTTYPSVTNGFERRFRGLWNVGLTLKVPVWNWGEGRYKVRAAKAEAAIARFNLDEVTEKIHLQIRQSQFRVTEAVRKLDLSENNMQQAEENLRTAEVGFREGVVTTTDLLAAQTAWLQARSDQIDSQIEVMITRSTLAKALGRLGE